MNKKRVTILGSTGSIGKSTLDVIARHPERFEVYGLCASSNVAQMLQQIQQFAPQRVVMADRAAADQLARQVRECGLKTNIEHGHDAIDSVASEACVDVVMAAIVGAAGLSPSLAAARAGKTVLLANKEALVVGGALFMQAVRDGGATLLPIDSEHSAIFQSLPDDASTWLQRVEKIILTASGGPFRTRDVATMHQVTLQQALAHPNWVMGRKISIDSATMMNKALEVIEAHYLFGLPAQSIEVVIHPQSIVHSMVQYKDASTVAQLGTPDMRVPIAYGLSWPERIESGAKALDFTSIAAMSFEAVQRARFPGLFLAWEVLAAPQGSCAILNAANEVAVAAFLEGRIRFDQIHQINVETLSALSPGVVHTLGDLLDLDERSRVMAGQWVLKV